MSISKRTTSVVHLSGNVSNQKVKIVSPLLGTRIYSVCGGYDKLYGLSEQGIYDIVEAMFITDDNLASVLSDHIRPNDLQRGKNHYVALTLKGEVFTWGEGHAGELGQGSKNLKISSPSPLPMSDVIVGISCGDYHTCVIDSRGNAYAWGQNFDKQLGLYNKPSSMNSGCSVEGIMMIPKFLPFSLKNPVSMMACGSRFTIAVTKNGDLWTWGAGECGQLGTGRCTSREQPTLCPCISDTGRKSFMISAACGISHVLAVSRDGELYSWGLNCKGQLGVGDILARHSPVSSKLFGVRKIFASGHSSACIDKDGHLYTWGSNIHGRLFQESSEDYFQYPNVVTRLADEIVHTFAFADENAAALVITKLLKVSPSQCPQKSVNVLQLSGCGFYASDKIIAKFLRVGQIGFVAPRSSVASLIGPRELTCKPPKFSEPGEYDVSVALNGADFTLDPVRILVYADPILNSFEPAFLDIRDLTGPVQVTLKGTYLDTLGEDVSFTIRFTESGKNSSGRFVEAKAQLVPEELPMENSDDDDHEESSHMFEEFSQDEENNSQASKKSRGNFDNERKLICYVDFRNIWASNNVDGNRRIFNTSNNNQDERTDGGSLARMKSDRAGDLERLDSGGMDLESGILSPPQSPTNAIRESIPYVSTIKAQLSINGSDLSKSALTQLICHRFIPLKSSPQSVSCKTGGRVYISGRGFFNSQSIKLLVNIYEPRSRARIFVPCTYVNSTSMFFDAPTMALLMRREMDSEDMRGLIYMELKFCFSIINNDGSEPEKINLHKDPFPFHYFHKPQVNITPSFIRRTGGQQLTLTLKDSPGFPVSMSNIRISFLLNNPMKPRISDGEMKQIVVEKEEEVVAVEVGVGQDVVEGEASEMPPQIAPKQSVALDSEKPSYYIACTCPSLAPSEEETKDLEALAASLIVPVEPVAAAPAVPITGKGSNEKESKGGKGANIRKQSIPKITQTVVNPLYAVLPKEVLVGVSLDRVQEPDPTRCTSVPLFDKITIKDVALIPKGGLLIGSNVTVNVEGVVANCECILRIRGTSQAFVEVNATVTCGEVGSMGTVAFQVPPTLVTVETETKSKVSNFFVDISIDNGQTFDSSETPILLIHNISKPK